MKTYFFFNMIDAESREVSIRKMAGVNRKPAEIDELEVFEGDWDHFWNEVAPYCPECIDLAIYLCPCNRNDYNCLSNHGWHFHRQEGSNTVLRVQSDPHDRQGPKFCPLCEQEYDQNFPRLENKQ